jgi:hypothetical protein
MGALRGVPVLAAIIMSVGACAGGEDTEATESGEQRVSSEEAELFGRCRNPEPVIVEHRGTLQRPSGEVLRLELVYQGSNIGIAHVDAVDMIIDESDVIPSGSAGYWVETRSKGVIKYQEEVNDPTIAEVPPFPGGEFSNVVRPKCEPKLILADVPNDPSVDEILVYGSSYGRQNRAKLRARFFVR